MTTARGSVGSLCSGLVLGCSRGQLGTSVEDIVIFNYTKFPDFILSYIKDTVMRAQWPEESHVASQHGKFQWGWASCGGRARPTACSSISPPAVSRWGLGCPQRGLCLSQQSGLSAMARVVSNSGIAVFLSRSLLCGGSAVSGPKREASASLCL